MRNFASFLIGLLIIISFLSCKSNKVALEHLEGSWLLLNDKNHHGLEYRRIKNAKSHFGSILNIAKGNTLIDSYAMKCLRGNGQSKLYFQKELGVLIKSRSY